MVLRAEIKTGKANIHISQIGKATDYESVSMGSIPVCGAIDAFGIALIPSFKA